MLLLRKMFNCQAVFVLCGETFIFSTNTTLRLMLAHVQILLLTWLGLLVATEMAESESVIHSLPHNGYPIPYSPLVYPPYGYPGYPHEMHSVREVHDAIRTQDADLLVRTNLVCAILSFSLSDNK